MLKGPRSSFVDQAIKGEFVAEALNGYLGTERKNSFVFFYSARQLDVIHIHLCGFTPPPPTVLPAMCGLMACYLCGLIACYLCDLPLGAY